MGDEAVDAKLLKQVKLTQELLGEFVKRPSLTEKHLLRPPFRYLHDVLMAVVESTGFFRGLFTPDELNVASLITKEAKSTFMEKIIAVVEITSGEKLEIRASKVLAGQEADKTNALLQTLAICLKKRQSSNEAVKSVTGVDPGNGNGKGGRRGSTSNEPAKPGSKGSVPAKSTSQTDTSGSKGKKSVPPAKTPVDNSKPSKSRGALDKGGAAGTKAATGPYAKAPSKTATPVQAPNKTKGGAAVRGTSQEKRGQGQPAASNRPRDRTPDTEDVPGTRSRRGSLGSPSTSKTRVRQKSVDKTVVEEPIESAQPLIGDSSATPPEDAQVNTQPSSEENPEDPIVIPEQKENEIEPPDVGEDDQMERSATVTRSRSNAGLTSDDENANENDGLDGRDLDNLSRTPEAPPKDVTTAATAKPSSAMKGENGRGRERERERPLSRSNARQRTEQQLQQQQSDYQNENRPPTSMPVATSSMSERKLPQTSRPPTSMRQNRPPTSARPSSARPGAPRPRSALVVQVDENAFRPPTGKVLNVLMDNEEPEEDGDNYIVQEVPAASKMMEELEEAPEMAPFALGEVDPNVPESQRGLLLNQILETQKELEGGKSGSLDDGGAGDSERVKYIRESARIEIEKLQNLIQLTAKSAHPLGKLMDFIQEDVDSIQGELARWQDESRKLDIILEEELAKTEAILEPLRQELVQCDDAIQDQEDAIDATRMEIQQQETRIAKILSGFDLIKPVEDFNKTIHLPAVVKVFGIDVELNDDDRRLVFGDGSDKSEPGIGIGIETITQSQSQSRIRPSSHYKSRVGVNPRQNSDEKIDGQQLQESQSQIDPDLEMRNRMKKLASSMARENPRDEVEELQSQSQSHQLTEDEMRSMTMKNMRQRRTSVGMAAPASTSSPSPSPTLSPAQSFQYM